MVVQSSFLSLKRFSLRLQSSLAVPEGLPMMLALVSSMNSGRLLAQNILVRHPDTIETAGWL